MTHLHNNFNIKQKRRDLRKNQTSHEGFLWSKLRNRGLNGYRFIRQYSIRSYILDFYCPETRLAIELDGSQHMEKENVNYDESRTQFLNSQNIRVLRFFNYQVRYDIDEVLNKILRHLEL